MIRSICVPRRIAGDEVEMNKLRRLFSPACPLIARAIAGVSIVHAGARSVAAIPEPR